MRTYNRVQQTPRLCTNRLEDLCRLCMNADIAMYDIFTVSENNEDLSLSSKILKCLSIEVKAGSELPNKLCGCCFKSVNALFDFWEQCHQTDRKLHHLIKSSSKSLLVKAPFHSPPIYSSCDNLHKSSEDPQIFSTDEEDPIMGDSLSHCAQLLLDFSSNASNVNETIKSSYELSEEEPNCVSSEPNLFENDVDATSPRYNLEKDGNSSDSVNDVQVQVSMNGNSYIVKVVEQSNDKDGNTMTFNSTNNIEKNSQTIAVSSLSDNEFVLESPQQEESPNISFDTDANMEVNGDFKGFACKLCSKYFSFKSSLLRHERIHSNERPYKCVYCSNSFKQKEVLTRHLLTHATDKPFKCDSCDKSYTQKEALKNHLRTNHISKKVIEIMQYKCPSCEKCFCHSSGLSRHQQSHTGKKYPCQSCEKVFTDQSCLKRHTLRAHLPGKSRANTKKGGDRKK